MTLIQRPTDYALLQARIAYAYPTILPRMKPMAVHSSGNESNTDNTDAVNYVTTFEK